MKRLFFALWPDQNTRQQCQQLIEASHGYGRPVATMNLHVTLVFLGHVDRAKQIAITQKAANIRIESMNLLFNRLSYWKKPAVLCLRADNIDPATQRLVEQLSTIARQSGLAIDERAFKPHITLLRKARSLPEILCPAIHWQADSFCLVESCPTPHGVEYRVVEQWRRPQEDR